MIKGHMLEQLPLWSQHERGNQENQNHAINIFIVEGTNETTTTQITPPVNEKNLN